jgi:type 1 fimbria pilin
LEALILSVHFKKELIMKNSIMVLVLLALLPATLQAAQGGTVHFTGKIAAPTCEISHNKGKLISSCYREISDKTFGFITMPIEKMSSELVSSATTELVNNNSSLQRVTISYN